MYHTHTNLEHTVSPREILPSSVFCFFPSLLDIVSQSQPSSEPNKFLCGEGTNAVFLDCPIEVTPCRRHKCCIQRLPYRSYSMRKAQMLYSKTALSKLLHVEGTNAVFLDCPIEVTPCRRHKCCIPRLPYQSYSMRKAQMLYS